MNNYQTFAITPNFIIEVLPVSRGFTLSDHEKNIVENIWNFEHRQFSHLYNGQILNVVKWDNDKLLGEFIKYKYYIAQLRDPNLQQILDIQTVSISGMTLTGEKILIGQRSDQVTAYKNYYELVPSGGIDPNASHGNQIDLKRQFEIELWEETGISVTEIKGIKPIALVYDTKNKSYEICAEINVNYTILKENLNPSEEYQKLQWFTKRELADFIQKKEKEFVPFSLFLLNKYLFKK